jgi:hypothetical protein
MKLINKTTTGGYSNAMSEDLQTSDTEITVVAFSVRYRKYIGMYHISIKSTTLVKVTFV